MTLRTLILRSLRHHARSHLGVLLGATIGSAVLIGALLVGDSVRVSLREMALARLGNIEAAMATGDRLFRAELATNLKAAPVLALPGTANSADGSRRANRVHILGVDESFWKLAARAPAFTAVPPDSVVLNQPLAEQLAAKPGDEVLLRGSKVSALSQDVSLTPRDGQSVALRLKVHAVAGSEELGGFSLQANQVAPFNAFVALGLLQDKVAASGRASVAVTARTLRLPSSEHRARDRNSLLSPLIRFGLIEATPIMTLAQTEAAPLGNGLLPANWSLADAQLDLHPLTNSAALGLRTDRIFLDPPAVRAALEVDTNAQPVLTYLVNLLRAGERTTPYSMVTAAGAPFTPADLRDDEIIINQWLADDLQVGAGAEIALTYFQPDSGARLAEATNRFRVRAVVPMQMPWADRTLMPDFPGIAKAERAGDWDAGFPLAHKIRKEDDDYWQNWRGAPKAFVSLSAGRMMWANRFGDTTVVRFPVRADVRRLNPTSTDAPSANQSETPHVVSYKAELEKALLAKLKPSDFGLVFQPVREQALKAAAQSQDFGGLFIGFSFFLIVAALVLMAMLFQFGVEQRAVEVGTLLALGFTPKQVRRMLLLEGAALALAGGVLGAVGGAWYARAMLHGLTTVWKDAVGTSALRFHATPQTLAIGVFAAVLVAVFTVWLALRKQVRQPARVLLSGGGEQVFSVQCSVFRGASGKSRVMTVEASDLPHPSPLPLGEGESQAATREAGDHSVHGSTNMQQGGTHLEQARPSGLPLPAGEGRGEGERPRITPGRRTTTTRLALGCLVAALALVGWAVAGGQTANAGVFFGAGALLLVAGLAFLSALLSRLERSEASASLSLAGMGVRNATRRRKRSLATATMLACGSFLIVSIGAFRLDENVNATKRASGTGGFALLGASTLPVYQDLNSQAGRDFLALDTNALAGVSFVQFRVRDGDDASCLNLNRAQKPRLLGVNGALNQRGAFAFTSAWSGLPRPLGWYLLGYRDETISSWHAYPAWRGGYPSPSQTGPAHRVIHGVDSVIPGIADEASILWALGMKLGDTLDFTDERGRPFKVRLVASLANSVLQGNIIIAEDEFIARFPNEAGYRFFLVDAPTNRVGEVSATLTRAMRDAGLELTSAPRRLAQFNAVQNTYLSTFQVLGGLGLLLGSAGLGVVVLRNVLERRGELALLLAVGFRATALRRLVLSEHGALLLLGLGCGVVAAAAAVAPAVLSPNAPMPYGSLALTLGAVLASGAVWTWLATVFALRGRLLDALRSE
jgi:ABC-type antimicrobial peptide transport system permease subunit